MVRANEPLAQALAGRLSHFWARVAWPYLNDFFSSIGSFLCWIALFTGCGWVTYVSLLIILSFSSSQ